MPRRRDLARDVERLGADDRNRRRAFLEQVLPELLRGLTRKRRQTAVFPVIEQETFDVRQRVCDHAVPERHSPVHWRSFAHQVVSEAGPAERALNQEQCVDMLRDEVRVLQSKRERVA